MNSKLPRDKRLEYAKGLLKKRYELCNSEGHQLPNNQTGICDYCDRHLIQKSEQVIPDKLNGLRRIIEEKNLR
jgi:hypothetical protein